MLTQEQKVQAYDKMVLSRESYNKKRNAKRNILVRKAIELGLDKEITDQDINDEIEKMSNKL